MNKSSDIRLKVPKNVAEDKTFLREYLRDYIRNRMESTHKKWVVSIILYVIISITSVLTLIINSNVSTVPGLLVMWAGYLLTAKTMQMPDYTFYINEYIEPKMTKFQSVISRFSIFIIGTYAYLSVSLTTENVSFGTLILRPAIALFILTIGLFIKVYSEEQFDKIIVLRSITEDELNNLCETIKSDISEGKDYGEVSF